MSLIRIYFLIISIVLSINIPYGTGQAAHGGQVISLVDYGYQAAVLIVIKNEVAKVCGGTIVSEFHVLTTASCFAKAPNDYYDIQVRVGSVNIFGGGEIYNVSKVERHPEFDTYISTHNLAIVFITNGIRFTKPIEVNIDNLNYIKSVNDVPMANQFVIGGDKVTVSGYSLKSMNTTSNNLQDIYTYSMSFFPCLEYFHKSSTSIDLIDDEILCVRNVKTNGFCDILEGSPVVAESKLVGIFSGETCNDENVPLLFTRIANNFLWLNLRIHGSRFKGTGEICSTE